MTDIKDFSAVTFAQPHQGAQISHVAVREPRADEVLVAMDASGVCHSDLHVVNGDWPFEHDVVLGHEGSGHVVECGPLVKSLSKGDRVTLNWYVGCGRCPACRAGNPFLCTDTRAAENLLMDGSTPLAYTDSSRQLRPTLGVGTHAEYAVVNEAAAVKIPDRIPSDVAAIIGCAVTTGVGAVINTARVQAGESCVVVGAGGVGQAVIMGLRLVGAGTIIAVDIDDNQLDIATRLGATHTLRGDHPELAKRVLELSRGGVDYAFDAIGHAATSSALLEYVHPGGAGVLVGMPARGVEATFDLWSAVALNKRLLGCNYGSSNAQIDFPRIAQLYLDGKLPLDDLIGTHITLAEVPAAITSLEHARGKRLVVEYT